MEKQMQSQPLVDYVSEGGLECVAAQGEDQDRSAEGVEGYDVEVLTSVLEG